MNAVNAVIESVLAEAVETIQFRDLKSIKTLAMVVTGAGGEPQQWSDGIDGLLKNGEIVTGDAPSFSKVAVIKGNKLDVSDEELAFQPKMNILDRDQGRTDLLLVFNPAVQVNVGKLAMWRLRFGDIMWLEDFVRICRGDYKA